jgi:hypothetical protein
MAAIVDIGLWLTATALGIGCKAVVLPMCRRDPTPSTEAIDMARRGAE